MGQHLLGQRLVRDTLRLRREVERMADRLEGQAVGKDGA